MLLEQRAFLPEVVQLAVVNDRDLAIGGNHRLMSSGARVDYREPRHAERYVLVLEYTTVVGSAMMQSGHHRANFANAITAQCSTDATHNFVFQNSGLFARASTPLPP